MEIERIPPSKECMKKGCNTLGTFRFWYKGDFIRSCSEHKEELEKKLKKNESNKRRS